MRKKTLVSAVTLAACMAAWPAQADQPAESEPQPVALERIAVVDFQRCIKETQKGVAASKVVAEWMKKVEARIADKQRELRTLYEDLQAKIAVLTPAEVERRQAELLRRESELQGLVVLMAA